MIITDIRGQHELEEVIKFNSNAKFIRIIRPTNSSTDINNRLHITQIEPNQIREEYITETIINDGTIDELREKVKFFLDKV